MGIVKISGKKENRRISATSTSSSSLIRNISFHLINCKEKGAPILQHSSVEGFGSLIHEQSAKGYIDPHLLVANIFAHNFYSSHLKPLSTLRVISVIIKGKRLKLFNKQDDVYLHVYKPEWGSYALIGSRQEEGQTDLDTANLALDEDLETIAADFSLESSSVEDVIIRRPEVSNGLHTKYEFNLYIAIDLSTRLIFRQDLNYKWFTIDEIKRGVSRQGESIITRYELFNLLEEKIGISSIPYIVPDVGMLDTGSWKNQIRLILNSFSAGFSGIWNVARYFALVLWRARWYLFTVFGVVGLLIGLKPILERDLTALSNIDSIIGILMFAIYLFGVLRRQQNRPK